MSQLPLKNVKNAAFNLLNHLLSVLLKLVLRTCQASRDCHIVFNKSLLEQIRIIVSKNKKVKSRLTTICKKSQDFLGCTRTGLPTLTRLDNALGGYLTISRFKNYARKS
jgi:hypothetical protein